jgi:hypothetical protein
MIRISQDILLKHPYPFDKLISLEYALLAVLFDDFEEIISKSDDFEIKYDETVDAHCLLHISNKTLKTKAICYLGKGDSSMDIKVSFLYHSILESFAEDLI